MLLCAEVLCSPFSTFLFFLGVGRGAFGEGEGRDRNEKKYNRQKIITTLGTDENQKATKI